MPGMDALARPSGRRADRGRGGLALWLAAVALLAATALSWLAGPAALTPAARAQAALTPMLPSDPLLGSARGSAASVLSFAKHYRAGAQADLELYLNEIYRLAPQVGLDPGIVAAQSALETDTWRTAYWVNHRNPAGIGITYDGAPSFTWANGTDAARGHLVHLYLYAVGEIPPGHVLRPYIPLDPRYDAAIKAGYAGIARTISDLAGRWATDRWYADKIAGRGNDLFLRHRIVAAGRTWGSTNAWLADDADGATAWETATASPPSAAYVWFDLGAITSIGTIRWLFFETQYADRMTVQVSSDRVSWRTLGTFGNAGDRSWQALATSVSARYVRFYFTNPNKDPKLGSLAEVQFWPPVSAALPWQANTPAATVTPTPRATATPAATATSTPSATSTPRPTSTPVPPTSTPAGALAGTRLALVGSGGTSGATWTGYVRDGRLATDWHTTLSSPPAAAYVYVDLGAVQPLTGVRWVFNKTGHADSLRIQLSPDRRAWTTVATVGNAPAGAWQQRTLSASARYVRFYFANPNGDPVLGYLAEVEVWGGASASALEEPAPAPTETPIPPTEAPTATATPTPSGPLKGAPLALVSSGGTSGATYTGRVRDQNPETDWHTTLSTPPTIAYVYVDLGEIREVTGVRWLFNQTGYADDWELQVSADKRSWTTIYQEGNAPALAWQERRLAGAVRYVRFYFRNPENDPVVGHLAEVEVWGEASAAGIQAAAILPTVLPTETPTPTDTPIPVATDMPVPPPTEPPTATATPVSTDTPAPPPTETPTIVPTETPAPTDTPVPEG